MVFLGDGPLGQMTAMSSDGGYVKGFVGNPLCDPLYKENGKVHFLLPDLSWKEPLCQVCCSLLIFNSEFSNFNCG